MFGDRMLACVCVCVVGERFKGNSCIFDIDNWVDGVNLAKMEETGKESSLVERIMSSFTFILKCVQ